MFDFGCKVRESQADLPDNYLSFAEEALTDEGEVLPTYPQIAGEVRDRDTGHQRPKGLDEESVALLPTAIIKDIKARSFSPVYVLMGEESCHPGSEHSTE